MPIGTLICNLSLLFYNKYLSPISSILWVLSLVDKVDICPDPYLASLSKMTDRLIQVITFYTTAYPDDEVFTTSHMLVQCTCIGTVECLNYNGSSTGLVHYPFSLSNILCKPDIRQTCYFGQVV